MISLELQASGDLLGRRLAEDVEELFYALIAMSDSLSERDIKELADYGQNEQAAAMLDRMAAALRGEVA